MLPPDMTAGNVGSDDAAALLFAFSHTFSVGPNRQNSQPRMEKENERRKR